jgi:hypothetical protein
LASPPVFGGLALVPLFPSAEPRLDYIGLDEAIASGLAVTEIDEAGSVANLFVSNPLGINVLLFEGEELVGAKQNRILDRSLLVQAKSKTPVPVSCVERGRWSYRSERFASAPRAAYPELRRAKREGGGQAEVWMNVAAKSSRRDAWSPTDASEEMYVSAAPRSRSTSHGCRVVTVSAVRSSVSPAGSSASTSSVARTSTPVSTRSSCVATGLY